jgi:hypothetical protein
MKALKSIMKTSLVNADLKTNLSDNLVMEKNQVLQPLVFNSTMMQAVAREDFSTFDKPASRNIWGFIFVIFVMLTGRSFVIGLTARFPALLGKARIYVDQNRNSVSFILVLCANYWVVGGKKETGTATEINVWDVIV